VKSKIPLVSDSYDFAKDLLKKDFSHSKKVVDLLYKIGINDPTTIAVAYLHHCLSSEKPNLKELKAYFGQEISQMVLTLFKIEKIKLVPEDPKNNEKIRKVLLALSFDFRVFLVKLACRLETLESVSKKSPKESLWQAEQALSIDAPLANSASLKEFSHAFEDLGFKITKPAQYSFLKKELEKSLATNKELLLVAKNRLDDLLYKNHIKANLSFRTKSLYSTHTKILKRLELGKIKEYSSKYINDLLGIRVITQTEKDCYKALDLINNNWSTDLAEFDNYIAKPKPNGYKSIHTAIQIGNGVFCEVQIRTKEMDDFNTKGGALHLAYKLQRYQGENTNTSWVKSIALGNYFSSNLDPFKKTIFVFTPKNDLVELPENATPIDFAYRLHTGLGNLAEGAIVNGKLVKLNTILQNGDTVEIAPSKKRFLPPQGWLDFVVTKEAKRAIRRYAG